MDGRTYDAFVKEATDRFPHVHRAEAGTGRTLDSLMRALAALHGPDAMPFVTNRTFDRPEGVWTIVEEYGDRFLILHATEEAAMHTALLLA